MFFNNQSQQRYGQRPPQEKANNDGFKRFGQPGNCCSRPPPAKRPSIGPQAPSSRAVSDWSPHRRVPTRESHPPSTSVSVQSIHNPRLAETREATPTDPANFDASNQQRFFASSSVNSRIEVRNSIEKALRRFEEEFAKERAALEAGFEKERGAWRVEQLRTQKGVEQRLSEQRSQLTHDWDEENKRLEASHAKELEKWKNKYEKERKRVERFMRAKDELAAKHSNVVDRLKNHHEEALQKLSADHNIVKLETQLEALHENEERLITENSFFSTFETKSAGLEETNANLQATVESFKAHEEELLGDLNECRNRIEELEGQVDARDKAVLRLTSRVAALAQEHADVEKEARNKFLQFVHEMDATFNKYKTPSNSG